MIEQANDVLFSQALNQIKSNQIYLTTQKSKINKQMKKKK